MKKNKQRTANIGLAIWRGDEYILSFCSLIGFSFGRRITPSNRINNELLFINLASVTSGRVSNTATSPSLFRWL